MTSQRIKNVLLNVLLIVLYPQVVVRLVASPAQLWFLETRYEVHVAENLPPPHLIIDVQSQQEINKLQANYYFLQQYGKNRYKFVGISNYIRST